MAAGTTGVILAIFIVSNKLINKLKYLSASYRLLLQKFLVYFVIVFRFQSGTVVVAILHL